MRAVGIVQQDGKILLIHRIKPDANYFTFPGGGVENGETFEQTLVREMKEELSIEVRAFSKAFELINRGNQEMYFWITQWTGDLKIGGPEAERMNDQNQYVLEWKTLNEIKLIDSLFPSEVKDFL